MTTVFDKLQDWELEATERQEIYERGIKVIARHGQCDLDDEFEFENLACELSSDDLRAYVFVREHQHNKAKAAAVPQAGRVFVDAQRRDAPGRDAQGRTGATTSAPRLSLSRRSKSPDAPLKNAIDRFAESKASAASAATIETYVSQCQLFAKIVSEGHTDLLLSGLTASHMQSYVDALHRMPIKIAPSDPRSMKQILTSSEARLSDKTKASHAGAVSMFLKWCEDQLYDIQPNLGKILGALRKPARSRHKRKFFAADELRLIFESGDYRNGSFDRDVDYWLPLLGVFTGARQAELCQLFCSDVYQDQASGIWLVDINDDHPEKRLKTSASRRQVPIHPRLIDLGLEKFVKATASQGQERLFPTETRNNHGEFGAYSKRFNRLIKHLGIIKGASTQLNFHSFRHTLQHDLLGQGCEEYIVNQIVGHTPARSSQSVSTYSKGATLDVRLSTLKKFQPNVGLFSRSGGAASIGTDDLKLT